MSDTPKGLRIDFRAGGAKLCPDQTVEGRWATVQAAMVNVGTHQGSDDTYPTRGTRLLRDSVEGRLVDYRAAQHRANFASADTLFFVREFDQAGLDPLQDMELRVDKLNEQGIDLSVEAIFISGNSIGTLTTL